MRKKPRPNSGKLDAQLQHAWKRHQAGQLAQAEEIYRGILTRAPSHPDANNLMGLLCIQSKKPQQAEKYIRKALRTDPQNPQSYYNLGIACADQHRYEDAALHFRPGIQITAREHRRHQLTWQRAASRREGGRGRKGPAVSHAA